VSVTGQQIQALRGRRNASALGAVALAALLAFVLVVTGTPNAVLAVLAVFFAGAALVQTRALRRMRHEQVPAGLPERPRTHAEAVAEAVEAMRQRQRDVIAGRAHLAAGGREQRAEPRRPAVPPPPAPPVARPSACAVKLDPRWEWRLVRRLGMPDEWVRGRCLHTEVEPVESAAGEAVAQLCLTCDTQFPAPREDGPVRA
jgi:hypothetical protein